MVPRVLESPQVEAGLGVWMIMGAAVLVVVVVTGFSRLQHTNPGAHRALSIWLQLNRKTIIFVQQLFFGC
jgi:hypothetical protein